MLELGLRRRLRPPPWRLGGTCGSCAACCERPTIRVGPWTRRFPPLRRTFLTWQRVVNGFLLVAEGEAHFVFRCTHFEPVTRRCDSYATRPHLCRDYPRALLDQPWPELFDRCGYRAIAPNAEGLAAEVDKLPLDEAAKADLRKKLRVE